MSCDFFEMTTIQAFFIDQRFVPFTQSSTVISLHADQEQAHE
jgi:hypothetical protein